MTKKEQRMYNNYLMAHPYTELWQVYGTFSRAKAKALDYCKELCYQDKGHGFKIVSHNSMMFTVGYEYEDKDGVCCFRYITRDNNYSFEL